LNRKLVRLILDILTTIILGYGLADIALWFTVGAMIPSWSIGLAATLSAILIQILKEKMKSC